MADLCMAGDSPTAVILESPFNNIRDEIKYHPLAAVIMFYVFLGVSDLYSMIRKMINWKFSLCYALSGTHLCLLGF